MGWMRGFWHLMYLPLFKIEGVHYLEYPHSDPCTMLVEIFGGLALPYALRLFPKCISLFQ